MPQDKLEPRAIKVSMAGQVQLGNQVHQVNQARLDLQDLQVSLDKSAPLALRVPLDHQDPRDR